jgi:hypothetical protein
MPPPVVTKCYGNKSFKEERTMHGLPTRIVE